MLLGAMDGKYLVKPFILAPKLQTYWLPCNSAKL